MYWGIAPEVNAFRLTMMGAGPTAHIPQLTGFETAAVTHLEQGQQMMATAAATSPSFVGLGGAGMTASALPKAGWLQVAGAHAQKAAATVQAGVDGYCSAVASTIPFPTVVANRVRETVLEMTNVIGQNAIPIAETNAEYGEFWGQNASAMMGYLSVVTGLLSSLSQPLPVLPGLDNPAATAAGTAASLGMSLGMEGAGAALNAGTDTATTAGSAAAATASGTASALASTAGTAGQASQAAQGAQAQDGAAGAAQPEAAQALQSAQGMMGSVMSAPMSLASTASGALSQAGQLPSMIGGQMSGLLSPALSAASGGLGGGPGSLAASPPNFSAFNPQWSGLGGANGGFAGGGSPVSAALTKPSAGVGMAGPVGLPAGWWNSAADAERPVAGARGASSGQMSGPMGSGMYGMPAGAGSRGRGTQDRDVADADKSIVLGELGDSVPVLTDDGGVVYADGQGV